MSTTVTSKGQVTIPKRVRDLLGSAPGSKVDSSGRLTVGLSWSNGQEGSEPVCESARERGQRTEHRQIMALLRDDS